MRRLIYISLILLGLSAGAAEASIWNTYGVAGRDIGMAGAYSAPVSDWTAVHYNPAGLARVSGIELSLGYFYEKTEIQMTAPDGTRSLVMKKPYSAIELEPVHGPVIGLVIPIPRLLNVKMPIDLAVGLGLFLGANKARIMDDSFRYPLIYGVGRLNRMSINGALAIGYKHWFRLGIGFSNKIRIQERLNARIIVESKGDKSFFLSRKTISNHDTHADLSPIVGLLIEPVKDFSIAAVYREKTYIQNDTDAVTDQVYLWGIPVINDPVYIKRTNYSAFTPRNFTFGLSYAFSGATISAEATYWQWSEFKALATGADPPVKFNDTIGYRLGAEWRFIPEVAVRLGAQYEPTPAPQEPVGFNYIDSDRVIAAAGIGYRLIDGAKILKFPVDFDLGFQFHQMLERSFDDGSINGTFTAEGRSYAGALTIRFNF